ncbi:MAG TPA: hypothetical protein PLD35_03315 [Caldisericia bacterium]|nr:hypothetical protein [Caldisericia bacterium]
MMNKIFFKEDGQSVVLIAVSILLIVFVGLSVFSLGEALNNKSQFRNLSDAVSFAGTCAQHKGVSAFQSLLNIDPLVKVSYNLGIALDNLHKGAKALKKVSPTYDTTANIIATSQIESLISPYNNLISSITSNPADPHVVDSNLYNETLSFFSADAIIFAREILEKNLEILPPDELKNLSMVSLPSEIFLRRGPILNIPGNPPRFRFELSIKEGKLVLRYYRVIDENTEIAESGVFNIMIADSPNLLFQQILPDIETEKLGKFLSFSYSFPFPEEGYEEGTPVSEAINLSYIQLEAINLVNTLRASMMEFDSNFGPLFKNTIENYWNSMVSDYNGFLDFINSNNFRAAFGLNPSSYHLKPVFASLKDMGILNIQSFKDLAAEKGYDINNEEDIKDFYKTLTLKDIFGTEENFRTSIEDTINTFATDEANVETHLATLMNKIKVFNKDYASGGNIPYILTNFVDIIYENLNESTLGPFLEVLQLIGNGVGLTYTNLNEFNTLVSLRTGYDFNSLKPDESFYNLLDHFFDTPLIKLEGT